MKKTITLTVAMIILLSAYASALGVTPALTTVNYNPGEAQTVAFSVTNTENRTIKAALSPQGEINLEVSDSIVELKPFETKKLSYSFTMPTNLESGTRAGSVTIQELPEKASEGLQVAALTAVITQLHVKVPYDGKEIESDIGIRPENENNITLVISVTNLGTEQINDLSAKIEILGNKIETPSQKLDPQKRTELKTVLSVPTKGEYEAKITISYDGKSKTTARTFSAGSARSQYYTPEKEPLEEKKPSLNIKTIVITIALLIAANTLIILRYRRKKKKSLN